MRIDVDYDSHPAFAPFAKWRPQRCSFAGIFEELDAAIIAHVDGRDAERRELSDIRQNFIDRIRDDKDLAEALKPSIVAALDRSLDRYVNEETQRRRWGTGFAKVPAAVRERAEQLLEQSYYMFKMPPSTLARLREVLTPDIERLRRLAAVAPDDIVAAAPSNHEAIWIVEDFCQASGLAETISAYFGQQYGQLGFVLHLSHPRDTWYRVFDDIKLEMPKTTQMHFDLAFEIPKAMLYLNDIDQKQGPFSMVFKEQPWERFGSEHAFRKEMLSSFSQFVGEQYGKTTAGNTSIFRHSEARRAMASMPKELRGTSHPGDHIQDGTILSNKLLAVEKRLVGEAGSMPLFLGSHVLHRGGLVTEGERLALQIVFPPGAKPERAVPPSPPPPLASPKPPGILRRVVRRLRQFAPAKRSRQSGVARS